MRSIAVLLVAVSSLGLVSCATGAKKGPPPMPEGDEPAAPQKVEVPDDGIERVDHTNVRPPKKEGFFSKLAKKAGNDNSTPNLGPCPTVRILYDASRFVEMNGDEKYSNVGFTGEMQNVVSSCRYYGDRPIDVSLQIDMALGRGPAAKGDFKDVKYWVSVVRTDIAPLAKQEFVNRITFPKGADRTRVMTPNVNITIPRPDKETSGANFEVVVGFDLNKDQLEFNRDGKRFRVNAGSN